MPSEDVEEIRLADTLLVFSVAAGVIIIGYLANALFRKSTRKEYEKVMLGYRFDYLMNSQQF
ncbi:MAG: hypothetical protein ABSB28_04050 [Candidatus Bathyarchaeia archaeon]